MVRSQKQEKTIKILLYTTELANLIKGLLLKIKSPTPHNPTENFWFAPFHINDYEVPEMFSQNHHLPNKCPLQH